jgi:hypothetical protein
MLFTEILVRNLTAHAPLILYHVRSQRALVQFHKSYFQQYAMQF